MPRTKIIVDTHYLIWDLQGHPNFDSKIEALFEDSGNEFYICSISYWEVTMLLGKKRIRVNQPIEVFCKDLQSFRNYKVFDISPAIAGVVSQYANLINGDPADRIIAATAISQKTKLLTRDQNLKALPFLDTI